MKDDVRFVLKVVVILPSVKELVDVTRVEEVKLIVDGTTVSVDIVLGDSFTGGVGNGVKVVVILPSVKELVDVTRVEEVKLIVDGTTVSVDIVLGDSFTGGVGNGVTVDDRAALVEVGNIETVLVLTVLGVTTVVSATLKDCVKFILVVVVKLTSLKEVVEIPATDELKELMDEGPAVSVDIVLIDSFTGGVDNGATLDDNSTLVEVRVISNVETVLALTVLGASMVVSVILIDCVKFITLEVVVKLTSAEELDDDTTAEELRDKVKLIVEGATVSVDVDSFTGGEDNGAILDDNSILVEVGNIEAVLVLTVLGATRVVSAILDCVKFILVVVDKLTSLKELVGTATAELKEVKLLVEVTTVLVNIVSFTGVVNDAVKVDSVTLVKVGIVEEVVVLTVLGVTTVVSDCVTFMLAVLPLIAT